jgi:hypothetical protein
MKKILITLIFLANSAFAQSTYSPETLSKIKEVENNITSNIIINDEKPSSIEERMAKYNIKGISIAVST